MELNENGSDRECVNPCKFFQASEDESLAEAKD
jgi:hypothetical protein